MVDCRHQQPPPKQATAAYHHHGTYAADNHLDFNILHFIVPSVIFVNLTVCNTIITKAAEKSR